MEKYDVYYLQKQFLCCTPLSRFKWPNVFSNINVDVQKQIINATVKSKLVLKLPIKNSYTRAFLKQFIDKLEECEIEINDEVYNTYCSIVAACDTHALMHYRHFLLNKEGDDNIISIKESTKIISEGTTGLCSWKAAFSLAEWCSVNKQEIQGKNVLELGSGVGLTGLAVIKLCEPKIYYFSDCHPIVLRTLEENIRLNLLENENDILWKEVLSNDRIEVEKINVKVNANMKVKIMSLKWVDINKLNIEQLQIDIVIAADILYDNSTFESLALGLKELVFKAVCYAIVAVTVRNESTLSEFLSILDKYNLAYEEETMSMPQIFIQSEDTPIRILKILRQK